MSVCKNATSWNTKLNRWNQQILSCYVKKKKCQQSQKTSTKKVSLKNQYRRWWSVAAFLTDPQLRSINKREIKRFCHPLGERAVFGKEMPTVSTQKEPQQQSAQLLREAIFPPTIHQRLLQSYWAFTRHLQIPDKRNKKHFKATLPAVPTLFHLSNAYKTVEEGQILLRGATAHLLPASAPLKTLLFLLKKEYTINLSHLLPWALSTRSLEAQTGPCTLTSIRAGNLKKVFPQRARLPEREDESWGNDAQEINTNQLSVWGGRQQAKAKKG